MAASVAIGALSMTRRIFYAQRQGGASASRMTATFFCKNAVRILQVIDAKNECGLDRNCSARKNASGTGHLAHWRKYCPHTYPHNMWMFQQNPDAAITCSHEFK